MRSKLSRNTDSFSKSNQFSTLVAFCAAIIIFVFSELINVHTDSHNMIVDDMSKLFYSVIGGSGSWVGDIELPKFSLLATIIYKGFLEFQDKNFLLSWQIILGVQAFFRAMSGFLAGVTLKRYSSKANNVVVFCFSILGGIMIPERVDELSYTPYLFFLIWSLLFLLKMESEKNKSSCSVLIALVTAALALFDWRYICVVVFIAFRYIKEFWKNRKALPQVVLYSLISLAAIVFGIIYEVRLFSNPAFDNGEVMYVRGSLAASFKYLPDVLRNFSGESLNHILSIFSAQIWELSTYSIGLLFMGLFLAISALKKHDKVDNLFAKLVVMFSATLIISSLVDAVMYSIVDFDYENLYKINEIFEHDALCAIVVPSVLYVLVKVVNKDKRHFRLAYIEANALHIAVTVLMFFIVIFPYREVYGEFSVFLVDNPSILTRFGLINDYKDLVWFAVFLVLFIAIVLYVLFNTLKTSIALVVSIIVALINFGLLNMDAYFNEVYNYLDTTVELNYDGFFDDLGIDKFYAYTTARNSNHVKLILHDKDVTVMDFPEDKNENYLLISNFGPEKIILNYDITDSYFVQIDPDEYVYFRGEKAKKQFEKKGYEVEFIGDLEPIKRLYSVILGRNADIIGLYDWRAKLNDSVSYSSAARMFFDSVEFTGRNYSDYTVVSTIYQLFFDDNLYDDVITKPELDDMLVYVEKYREEKSIPAMMDYFYNFDECLISK